MADELDKDKIKAALQKTFGEPDDPETSKAEPESEDEEE